MTQFKSLYIFEEEEISQPLVYFSDFYKLLSENPSSSDKHKLRSDNFQRELNGYKTSIIHLEHGKAVTVTSVLKYIIHHFDDYKICHDLGLDIEQLISKSQKVVSARTTLGLYKALAEQQLVAKDLEQQLKHINIDNRNIPSLMLDHKKDFVADPESWERICLFENYFSIYFYNKDLKFEETLKAKWNVFESLKSLRETSKKIQETTRSVIQNRTQRKDAHEETNSIVIVAGQKHRPAVIEKQMMRRLDGINSGVIDRIVCIDTHESQSNNSIMVCVSIDSIEGVDFNEVASAITNVLLQHHKVNVSCIHFLSSEELKDCQRNHSVNTRFSLRVLDKRVNELNILFSIQPTLDKILNDDESGTCNACFSDSLPEPLDISTFDLLQEWYLDVPLDMQILLQSFINPSSLRTVGNTQKYIKGKLEHLYSAYDVLLHLFNSKYFGVHQRDKLNVDELSSYFDIVKTVFSSGITYSLPTAGKSIEESTSSSTTNSSEITTHLPPAGKSIEESSAAATTSSLEITSLPSSGKSIVESSSNVTTCSSESTTYFPSARKCIEESSPSAITSSSEITSLSSAGKSIEESSSIASTCLSEITTYLPSSGKSIAESSSTATTTTSEITSYFPSAGKGIDESSSSATTSSSEITSLSSAGKSIEESSSIASTCSSEITTYLPSSGKSIAESSSTATTTTSEITSSLPSAGQSIEKSSSISTNSSSEITSLFSAGKSIEEGSAAATTSSVESTSSSPSAGKSIEESSSIVTISSAEITLSLPLAGKSIEESSSIATNNSPEITTSLPSSGKSVEESSSIAQISLSGSSSSLQTARKRIQGRSLDEIVNNLFSKKYSMTYGLMEGSDEHRFEKYHGVSYQQKAGYSAERDRPGEDSEKATDQGGPAGSKPTSLSMMSPAGNKLQRNTATVSPLDHVTSPTNGVTSMGANAALNASRTSSFAAALRKLANQAKDAPAEESSKGSTTNSPREATTKAGPPPLVYTSTPLTTPPVGTIAPTQTHPSLLSSDVRPPMERLHSSHSTSSLFDSAHVKPDRDRPQSSASRDEGRASRDGHSQSARRVTPHSTPGATPPLSAREETARGFQPYRPGDDMRQGLPSSLALEQAAAAAAAYSYPTFLPPHAFPHPAFRFDDPMLLERYRMMQHPYLPYGPPGMLPHPSLHPLMAAGGRYPPELLHPHIAFNSQAGRIPEHRSPSLHPDRQRLEDEKRDLEREREKERERERDMAIYRERQRALERESEKQRDRDRSCHRDREEKEKRDLIDKPKSEGPANKVDESLTAKFGSIIQGTPKGLGIADRYPRAPTSSHSASLTLSKREERRDSKDDGSNSFLNNSFNRLPAHKSSTREDQKNSETDKRYSLVTPMSSSDRTGPPPLISPKSGELKPNKSDGNLFRPFDSKFLTNGFSSQHHEKDRLIHHRGDLDTISLDGKKQESERGLKVGHVLHDQKSGLLSSGEKSLHSSKFGSSTSAFHSLDSHAASDVSKLQTDPKHVQSTHSICSPLHHSSQKESLPLNTLHNSNQTPLNIPAYNAKGFLPGSNLFPESQSCVSKLDLEEKKLSESRSNGSYCSDSDCDVNSDDNEEVKNLLISSGPPLQLDTCRKKMTLLKELGLTTHRRKKDKQFELFRERRRKMHERSVSPMNVEEMEQRLSPLKSTYPPEQLCRQPDYKMKCQFMYQMLGLEPVPPTTRLLNEIIYKAIDEDKTRRKSKRESLPDSPDLKGSSSEQPDRTREDNPVNISQSRSSYLTSLSQLNCETSQSDINRHNVPSVSTGSLSQLSELTTSIMRHSSDVKSEPGEISYSKLKLSRSFAEEFHRSVLQTTKKKECVQKSGEVPTQGHPSHLESQSSRSFPYQQPFDQWPGVDVVMETYQKHNIDGGQERQILVNRTRTLQVENKELSKSAEILSKRMEELLKNKHQLEEERLYRQTRIDGLKSAIKKLKN